MKNTMLLCALFSALAISAGVHAADTAELQVKGSVRPSACTLTLSADGVVDYGRIPASRLSDTKVTSLGGRTVNYAINCANGAARVALQITDNRKSSVVKGMALDVSKHWDDSAAFGLGIVDGKTIGIYLVVMNGGTQANGGSSTSTLSPAISGDGGKTWRTSSSGYLQLISDRWYSWGSSYTDLEPVAISNVSGTLTVVAFIDKLGNIPPGNDIPLDGLTTLEMRYL
jgi:type 1 fimbria pilin